VKKLFCFAIVVLALSACSSRYSSTGESVYLQSRNGEKINVPPPLTSANISSFYDLPAQNENARVNISPPKD
jgi:uncharacterized lipoprotein